MSLYTEVSNEFIHRGLLPTYIAPEFRRLFKKFHIWAFLGPKCGSRLSQK